MTETPSPRIVLIHAVTLAMDPVRRAFDRLWPSAEIVNLLDDSLSPDRALDGDLTETMSERIAALGDYAVRIGADAALFTCSAFGPAIEAVATSLPLPVLKPNEAMFAAALDHGRDLGMLATFGPSLATMEAEFAEERRQMGKEGNLRTVLVEEAMSALKAGDVERHNHLLAEAAADLRHCDAVMLAHFSTSRARDSVAKAVPCPVLSSPDLAVNALMARLGYRSGPWPPLVVGKLEGNSRLDC